MQISVFPLYYIFARYTTVVVLLTTVVFVLAAVAVLVVVALPPLGDALAALAALELLRGALLLACGERDGEEEEEVSVLLMCGNLAEDFWLIISLLFCL